MNPEDPNVQAWLEPELEARVVASLLGEASPFEEAELARLVNERPEIAVFQRRLQAVHGLVGEAIQQGPDDEWKLSKERRTKVLETIRGRSERDDKIAVATAKQSRKSFWYGAGAAAVAVVTLFVSVVFTMTGTMSVSSRDMVAAAEESAGEPPALQRGGESVDRLGNDFAYRGTRPGVVEFEGFVHYDSKSTTNPVDVQLAIQESLAQETDLPSAIARPAIALSASDGESAVQEAVTRSDAEANASSEFAFTPATPSPTVRRFDDGGNVSETESLAEQVAEDYATFGDTSANGFGQISGINVIGKNLQREQEVAQTDWGVIGEPLGEAKEDPEVFFGLLEEGSSNALAQQGRGLAEKRESSLGLIAQQDKVEEARLAYLDTAERYRNIDYAAMANQPMDGAADDQNEDEQVGKAVAAKQAYESEREKLRTLEQTKVSEQLGALLQTEESEPKDRFLASLADKVGVEADRLESLSKRYNIPELLKRQDDDIDGLSLAATEAKKDTALDDQRRLAEYQEVEQELGFRKKLAEKAKQALIPVSGPAKPQPLTEKHAKQEPFSTFSLHVSDVAFKLAKAALLDSNSWPEVDKVRIEEFVNAFDYGDPAPSQTEKVACRMEQAAHPFRQQRNLLRVSMRTAEMGRSSATPLQLTLLLDTSGSMERADRQASIERAMQVLTSQLTPKDTVTLIGFARQPRLIQDRLTGEALANLPQFVKQTPSEGGTNLEEALLLGIDHARRQLINGGQNRIVLITDGAANLGDADAESLRELVVGMRQEGIAFDACGVGAEGLDDSILEALTRQGDGRYYLLNKPEDADDGFARQLAGAFRPAARNVKVQVNFNDRRVGSYRLLGFEKHLLNKEDFRNDQVDAAEMASSEAGVALYEIEPLAQGSGEIGEVSVRFQDMSTGRMVERRWTISYNASVPRLEEASPSLQLASTAAFLAEKLKRTTFGELVDFDQLSQLLTNLRQSYARDARVADLIAMVAKVREL